MKKQLTKSITSPGRILKWIRSAATTDVFKVIDDYAVMVLDTNGDIAYCNRGAEQSLGYLCQDVAGRNFKLFFSTEDKNEGHPERLLEAALNAPAAHEGWRLRSDGSRYWAAMSISAIKDTDDRHIGFLALIRDLSERKTVEDQLSNRAEALRQQNAELKKREAQYHRMVAEVQDYAIILLSPEGDILDWNRGAEQIKKYKAAEIVGKNFKIFYPEEDKLTNLPERLLNEARVNNRVNHEGWRVRKDGTRFWGNVTITALHGDDNEVIGFTKVTRDLTERKMAEDRLANASQELRERNEELRRSEEQYHRMVAEVSDYAILLLDINGDILNWNAGAASIKGYSEDEIVGKSFRVFYTNADREAQLPEKLLQQALVDGRVTHEGWRVRKDGTRFWGSVVITALHDTDGNVIGFSKVVRDLTERKQAEDELRATAAKLQLTNQELASFTHVASHDLKEPLRKIRMFISQIEDMELPEKAKNSFIKIAQSARNMQALIDDLLAYSLVANDKTVFTLTDLNQVASEALGEVEGLLEEKGASIDVGALPVVEGVTFQLRQVFQNLISNALKFSREGVRPFISIRCEKVSGRRVPGLESNHRFYRISVSDNGVGFAQDDATKIFEPFERLPATKKVQGTGIGLAIVKKVIENHGGTVTAHGRPGEGATIDVYLPVNLAEN